MITVTREKVEAAEKELAWLKMNQVKDGAIRMSPTGPNESPNAPRRPQIHQELEELGCAVESLENAIAVLHDRLSMVTRPLPPCAVQPPQENEQKVPLSSVISEYRKKVRQFQSIITELTDRLEV